jgi:hypothetical protein
MCFRREVGFFLLWVFISACIGSAREVCRDFSPDVFPLFGFSEIFFGFFFLYLFHWGLVLWFATILFSVGLYFI